MPEVRSSGPLEGTELGKEAWEGELGSLSPPFPRHLRSDSDSEELDTSVDQFPRYPPPQAAGGEGALVSQPQVREAGR